MVAVPYGVAPAVDREPSTSKRKGVFTIMFEAIADAQMKRAERELARWHSLRAHTAVEDEPFGGW